MVAFVAMRWRGAGARRGCWRRPAAVNAAKARVCGYDACRALFDSPSDRPDRSGESRHGADRLVCCVPGHLVDDEQQAVLGGQCVAAPVPAGVAVPADARDVAFVARTFIAACDQVLSGTAQTPHVLGREVVAPAIENVCTSAQRSLLAPSRPANRPRA